MIQQDMYYKDQSNLSMEERVKTNYDHPMAFDNDLLVEHLQKLIKGKSIEKPRYDFTVHNRAKDTTTCLLYTSCVISILSAVHLSMIYKISVIFIY